MALSRVVSEIFNVEKCRDLEIGVRGHSRSLKVVPFDRLGVVSYQLVTLSLKCTIFEIFNFKNLENWVRGPSRSLEISVYITIWYSTYDFLLTFYSNHGSISCCFWDIHMLKNVATLKSGSKVTQGHWKWYHTYIVYGFLLVFFSNFVPKMHWFRDIRLGSIEWPWNPGFRSLKVIENDTSRSGTHNFLLTFHSNHWPISHHFRDKRRFLSKSPIFPTPVYL